MKLMLPTISLTLAMLATVSLSDSDKENGTSNGICTEVPTEIIQQISASVGKADTLDINRTFAGSLEGELANCWGGPQPNPELLSDFVSFNASILSWSVNGGEQVSNFMCSLSIVVFDEGISNEFVVIRVPLSNYLIGEQDCIARIKQTIESHQP